MDIVFYCQACDFKISSEAFGSLSNGCCPECNSMEGFSTMPKDVIDPFTDVTMINDSDILQNEATNG